MRLCVSSVIEVITSPISSSTSPRSKRLARPSAPSTFSSNSLTFFSVSRAFSSLSFRSLAHFWLVTGVAFGNLFCGVLVGNRHHAHQVGGQLGVVRANLVRLVEGPLIRCPVLLHRGPRLVQNRLGVRAMAQ